MGFVNFGLKQLAGPLNVSDTCNINTNTMRTRLAKVCIGSAFVYHSYMSVEHSCVNRLNCCNLNHFCAQKKLSYCLVEGPIERFCDRL